MNRTMPNAKAFLSRAYHIDHQINSKLEQVWSMRSLAAKVTSMFTDMPRCHFLNTHSMESVIIKIIDLENEINAEIDALVDTKREIIEAIRAVEKPEHKTVLELRYLCFKTWSQIAENMCYTVQNIYYLHDNALKKVAAAREV